MLRRTAFGLSLVAVLLAGGAQAVAITILHEFAGGANDGFAPYGGLAVSGSTIFGTTNRGGDNDAGTVFSIENDGSNFTLLHEFLDGANDGPFPYAGLTLSGSTLFGTTLGPGDNNPGTIFAIGSDGSGFTVLHEFAGGANDGRGPYSPLTLSGTTLFGMTRFGGDNDRGTIFSVGTDGTGFTLLHEFAGGANDGHDPWGRLTLSGSMLFGTTRFGGDNGLGTIFSIGTDGSGFTLLHEFAGGANDGRSPRAGLVLSGSTLFGTTNFGSSNDAGTIFSIGTDGSGLTLLHEFAGGANDGSIPDGGLTLSGATLFGTTLEGGDDDFGTVFSIETDGNGYALLHDFAGVPNDGWGPHAALTLSGATLFGTTYRGGDNDRGTVFSLEIVPEPGSLVLVLLGGLVAAGVYSVRRGRGRWFA